MCCCTSASLYIEYIFNSPHLVFGLFSSLLKERDELLNPGGVVPVGGAHRPSSFGNEPANGDERRVENTFLHVLHPEAKVEITS